MERDEFYRVPLGRGSQFRIVLSSKEKDPFFSSGSVNTDERREEPGLMIVDTPPDELVRIRKTGNFINFWDLGLIFDTVTSLYKDLAFQVVPSITFDGGGFPSTVSNFTASNWASFFALLLTPALADFKTHYKRIEYALARNYGIVIKDKNNAYQSIKVDAADTMANGIQWTPTGLKYSNELLKIQTNSENFFDFNTLDTTNYKITATPISSDPAVALGLTGNIDVFMIPKLGFEVGVDEQNDGAGNSHTGYLNWLYAVPSRKFFLANEQYHTLSGGFYPLEMLPSTYAASDPTGFFNNLQAFIKTQTNARFYITIAVGGVITFQGWASPNDFPVHTLDKFQMYYHTFPAFGLETIIGVVPHWDSPGTYGLVGIIMKGVVPYYIWATGSSFISDLQNTSPWEFVLGS